MQWSAWARPALRLSDVPWECQMWGHPSRPLRPDPSPNALSLAQLTLALLRSPSQPSANRRAGGKKPDILKGPNGRETFQADSSRPCRRHPPLLAHQCCSNEMEVMSAGPGERGHAKCPSRFVIQCRRRLTASFIFGPHKTRGGTSNTRICRAFPFEYKCYFTPDVC